MTEVRKDPIETLHLRKVRVLSLSHGEYAIPDDLREVMCLTSDMYLTVLSGSETSSPVLAYREKLKRRGVALKGIRKCSIGLLRRIYAELSDEPDGTQKEIEAKRAAGGGMGTAVRQIEVMSLIREAVSRSASDIHITVHRNFATIAFRIHGDMYKVRELSEVVCREMCSSIYQSMCDVAEETYKPHLFQDARIKADFVKRVGLYGSRVASGPTDDGSRMVIRLLYDSGKSIPTLKQLGYLPEQISLIETMREQTSGINILSGATGSGKSTTLVSVLSEIIDEARHAGASKHVENEAEEFWGVSVVTIEDPPEYTIKGAVQTPLGADKTDESTIRLAWTRAIAACMRQDPDIMMIGEIRDAGSARAAFDAAMTGHGVWTTVHTTDAIGIMSRLSGLDVPTDRLLDPEIVTGLINQSLAQRLCPHCSLTWQEKKDGLAKGLRDRIRDYCDTDTVRFRGPGCEHCSHGITGRVVVAETIMPNLAFMETLGKKGKAQAKLYWIDHMHGITKCMAMIRRINEGLIDPENAESSVCSLAKDFLTLGLDYRHNGDHAWGRAASLARVPDGMTRIEYAQVLAVRNAKEGARQVEDPVESKQAANDTSDALSPTFAQVPALPIQMLAMSRGADATHESALREQEDTGDGSSPVSHEDAEGKLALGIALGVSM